jgi:hypothetical protein
MGKTLGWLLAWIVGIILILTSIPKILFMEPMVSEFARFGLIQFMVLLGFIELVIAILFLIPRTIGIGTLLLSAFLGGAITVLLIDGQMNIAFIPLVIMAVGWISTALRRPRILS